MATLMNIQTHMLGNTRVGQFTDLKQLSTAEVVKEALDGGFASGKQERIMSQLEGVLKSMAAGISKDGNGRKIDGYVSLQPSLKHRLADICDPVDKANCKAGLKARALSEGKIDTSDWGFVIEGSTSGIEVTSITTGEEINEVVPNEVIDINGKNLTGVTVKWALADGSKSGTVEASKAECIETRVTIDADVLIELVGATYVGKILVFTVTKGNQKAIKSVTIRAAA